MSDFAAHAHSFGPAAEIYDRGRPTYPDAALDWVLPTGKPRVVDLGAGTGKLTRSIKARGLAVTAVDPSEQMLAQLRRAVPGVPTLAGSAEAIPLPDASADAVVVGQAWHWVDKSRAVPEVARVLAPGGRLGLLWNLRDETHDWVRRLGEIIGSEYRSHEAAFAEPFGAAETASFAWVNPMTRETLLDMVASRSRIILLPPEERTAVLNEVRELVKDRADIDMPYVTYCVRALKG